MIWIPFQSFMVLLKMIVNLVNKDAIDRRVYLGHELVNERIKKWLLYDVKVIKMLLFLNI